METIKIISKILNYWKIESELTKKKEKKKKETKFQKDIFQNIKASRFTLGIYKKNIFIKNLTYIEEKDRNKREKKSTRAKKNLFMI